MIKHFITAYKKENLYGDCHVVETGWYYPFRGRVIRVQILWLFWITYRYYEI